MEKKAWFQACAALLNTLPGPADLITASSEPLFCASHSCTRGSMRAISALIARAFYPPLRFPIAA